MKSVVYKPQNLIERTVQAYAVGLPHGKAVQSGDYIRVKPAHILTHDNTSAIMTKFGGLSADRIHDPGQPVFTLDHDVQSQSADTINKYRNIQTFAKKMGVDFYNAGSGIGHQIMIDEGYAFPGSLAVASDSHANMYGGIGCLGFSVVRTDAAAIWAAGTTWWQVPPVVKVICNGSLATGVTGKDVIISLIGSLNNDDVLNHALEFHDDGIKSLSIDDRLTIANMSTEWGAVACLFPVDNAVVDWLENRRMILNKIGKWNPHPRINGQTIDSLLARKHSADPDALYAKSITINLSTIVPYVSGPDSVKITQPVTRIADKNIPIQKAYLVSCVNSRVSDFEQAASIAKGKKVADNVEFYMSASSREIQEECNKKGYWQTLIDAGAKPLLPGCNQCIGLGEGLLKDGEIGISSTNRNFKGRMGSRDAQIYLASPAVVVASAIAGRIVDPIKRESMHTEISCDEYPLIKRYKEEVLIPGFQKSIAGNLLLCLKDNINTDGIYPGKYTYDDSMTPEQMASVVMENYDESFSQIAQKTDILFSGYNFGTGSSREQAVTAFKHKGIQCIVAGSINQNYKRNAFNNGFIVLESSSCIDYMLSTFKHQENTVRPDLSVTIDFGMSIVVLGNIEFRFTPLGQVIQELIVSGGLVSQVHQNNSGE